MDDELKPCPFCGGEPEVAPWEVHCTQCSAHLVEATTAEAIAAWNTRAAITATLQEEVTPAMIEAGRNVADGVDDSAFERIYTAMRRAATSEGDGDGR